MTSSRFLHVGRGYSSTAALSHPIGGLPQLSFAGMSDARGLLRHDRASLDHNPRGGKCLTGAIGEGPATTLIRDRRAQSTTLRKESKCSKVSFVSRV